MLEIKKCPVEMQVLGGGGVLHTPFYIHMPDRLDKSCPALADGRLKIYKPPKMQTCFTFTDSRFISLTCQNMRANSDTKLMKRTSKRDKS